VILNHLLFTMPARESVHAPRIHHQWMPDKLFVELKDAPTATVKELRDAGHAIENMKQIGDVQAIFVNRALPESAGGGFTGVSDTRSEGMPKGI
jgi:gamma-glutamyltranspeptidase/glutathione hydrolase